MFWSGSSFWRLQVGRVGGLVIVAEDAGAEVVEGEREAVSEAALKRELGGGV